MEEEVVSLRNDLEEKNTSSSIKLYLNIHKGETNLIATTSITDDSCCKSSKKENHQHN